jgi:hypothetical protein
MSIKRFGYGLQDDDLLESPVGPYVHWEDYEKLQRAYETELLRNLPKGDVVRVRSQVRLVEGYCCCPKSGTPHERTPQCDV